MLVRIQSVSYEQEIGGDFLLKQMSETFQKQSENFMKTITESLTKGFPSMSEKILKLTRVIPLPEIHKQNQATLRS